MLTQDNAGSSTRCQLVFENSLSVDQAFHKQGAEAPMSTPLLTKPVDMWWGGGDIWTDHPHVPALFQWNRRLLFVRTIVHPFPFPLFGT